MNSQTLKRENANRILEWARHEIRLKSAVKSDHVWNIQNISGLLKGNTTTSLWQYVIEHVKHKESNAHILNNLSYAAKVVENEKLMCEKEKLQNKLEALNKENESKKLVLKKLKSDLRNNNLNLTNLENEAHDNDIRSCFSKTMNNKLEDFSTMLQSYAQWFTELNAMYVKNKSLMPGSLDKNCVADALKICNGMVKLFNSKERNESESFNSEYLGNFIASLNSQYLPEDIVLSLKFLCNEEAVKLKGLREKIDFVKDLQEIEEQSQQDDKSLIRVKAMIQQMDIDCVNTYVNSKECLDSATKNLVVCDSLTDEIYDIFKLIYGEESQEFALAMQFVDAKIKVAAMNGTLRSFQDSELSLRMEIEERQNALSRLQELKLQMDNFKFTLDKNQSVIVSTVKHNSSVKGNLVLKQAQINEFVSSKIIEKNSELENALKNISASLNTRTALMNRCCFMTNTLHLSLPNGGSTPFGQITLRKYTDSRNACGGATVLNNTCSALNIHAIKPPSCILGDIAQKKEELCDLDENAGDYVYEDVDVIQGLQEVNEKGKSVDARQKEMLTEILNHGNASLILLGEKRLKMNEEVTMWADQPAKEFIHR